MLLGGGEGRRSARVRQQLVNLNELKSTGPGELHLTVLKEPLSVIFEKFWRTAKVSKGEQIVFPSSERGRRRTQEITDLSA